MTQGAPLGASEFAATLNGDNPRAILKVLKQFAKTVRKERRLALSIDDDDDESDDNGDESSSSEEEEEEEVMKPPNKKFKKTEDWKEDTQSYQVPFVGTSVARGETSEVVRGQWPTGLLQAYLNKSPLAIELTSDDLIPPEGQIHKSLIKHKKGRLSRAIYRAYLGALAELVTATIPLSKLKEEEEEESADKEEDAATTSSASDTRFLQVLLKKRLAGIFKLLNEETDRGRGKAATYGGCGNLAAPALKLLQNLSLVSTTNARLVARYLDEELSDGVLRALLRPPPPPRQPASEDDDKKKKRVSKPARVEAIDLASTLLQTQDSAVATYICTSGSKERKVKPGILFIALREGLAFHPQSKDMPDKDENYLDATASLLGQVRPLLLNRSKKFIGQRLLAELLSRDPLNHLCQLGAHAPPLTPDIPYQKVLAECDEYPDLGGLENCGVEARRVLFCLLTDASRSPLLNSLGRNDNSSQVEGQKVVQTLIRLLQDPKGRGVQTQQFLVHCIEKTPALLPNLFRVLSFPEPKNVFGFISNINFVSTLIREGPSPLACILPNDEQDTEVAMDDMFVTIVPLKLRKHPIAKALQSGNPLVVLECLKLIARALERFDLLKSEGIEQKQWSQDYVDQLSTAFAQWLPDLQIILTVRTKFDGFSRSKVNMLISNALYSVVESFCLVLPSLVRDARFDWMKLLPSAEQFSRATPIVQRRVLKSLKLIIDVCKGLSNKFLNSCRTVLEIMLTTKCRVVHSLSRDLALSLLIPVMESKFTDNEKSNAMQRESTWWIDALTIDCLPAFCKILNYVSDKPLDVIASGVGPALATFDFSGTMEFSLFLMAALNYAEVSSAFSSYVVQVAARCLMVHRNPMPLVGLIQNVAKRDGSPGICKSQSGQFLVEYTRCLVDFDLESSSLRFELLGKLLRSCFSSDDEWVLAYRCLGQNSSSAIKDVIGKYESQSFERSLALVRFLIHCELCSGRTTSVPCLALLRRAVPTMLLLVSGEEQRRESTIVLNDLITIHGCNPSTDFQVLDLIVKSCPSARHVDFLRLGTDEEASSLYESTVGKGKDILSQESGRFSLLRLSLLGGNLSQHSVAKVKLSLMTRWNTEGEQVSNIALRSMLCFIKCTNETIDQDGRYDSDMLRQIFQVWWSTYESARNETQTISLLAQSRSHFSSLLRKVLEKADLEATMLLSFMDEQAPGEVIDRCLTFSNKDISKENHEEDMKLLKTVLVRDPLRCVPPFLERIVRSDSSLSKAWAKGMFDQSILAVLCRPSVVLEQNEACTALMDRIVFRAVLFFAQIADGGPSIHNSVDLLEMTIMALTSLNVSADGLKQLSEGVLRLSTSILEHGVFPRDTETEKVCQLGILLVSKCQSPMKSDEVPSVTSRLASTMFVLLCEFLQGSYKAQSSEAHSSLGAKSVLTWLISLLEDVHEFELNVFQHVKPTLLQKVCRSCLKYGLTRSTDHNQDVPVLSLQLVRALLTRLSNSPIGMLKEHLPTPSPAEVFMMLTAHSKFHVLLSQSEEVERTCDRARLEVVRLMLCCVTLSPDETTIEPAMWKTLYSALNAGLGELDTTIRQLFYACCKQSKDIHVPFLDEFRWRGFQERESREGDRWDWLLSALDTKRIRATISHFPLFDTTHLIDDNAHESEGNSSEGGKGADKEESMCISDDDEHSEEEEEEISDDINTARHEESRSDKYLVVNGLAPGSEWDEDGRDIRYSPAFILPLLLGALESGLLDDDSKGTSQSQISGENSDKASSFKYHEAFVSIAQRMCEKGVIGLSLASLSSRSNEVRGLAVSILGLLLRACATDEARERSSWRERPQMAMLLNSVQRAFVLKRASDIMSGSHRRIPILPPVVATFLARASLSITKPDDALYVPLNRFFLKTERDHGAFQDMNRLPGFISLFCSSSDDPGQSRKERMWALQLLRDGFLDASDYRLVVSCHAPELILTSFENVRLSSQASEDMKGAECSLLLDVIRRLIEYGGRRAASHLVGRIGLLSWMRSSCIGSRPLQESFPTTQARLSFCKLVCSAVQSALRSQALRSDIFVHELCGLVQPLLDMFVESDNNSGSKKTDPALLCSICQALDSLRMALTSLKKEEGLRWTDVQPLGFTLKHALCFLKAVPTDQLGSATLSLSYLPFSLNGTCLEDASAFCSSLLGFYQKNPTDDETALQSVLKRVTVIANHYGGSSLASDCNILDILLSDRSQLVATKRGHRLWRRCLKVLVSGSTGNDIEVTIARDILKSSSIVDSDE